MIAMMGRNSNSSGDNSPSPTRLSPHLSFSVMTPAMPDLDIGLGSASADIGTSHPAAFSLGGAHSSGSNSSSSSLHSSLSALNVGNNNEGTDDESYNLTVVSPSGVRICLDSVLPSMSIIDCKEQIHQKEGIPVDVQQWMYNGLDLCNDALISNTIVGVAGSNVTIQLIINAKAT